MRNEEKKGIKKYEERETGGNMKRIKGVMESIKEYIRGYFSGGVFMKSVSLMVAACFIINIANLPAIASDSSIYEKQKKQQEMKEEKTSTSVSYVADESRGSVSYMQNLSDNIEIKEGVIYGDKGNGKKEPVGFWDGKKALIADGEGKLNENKAYTDAVNKKLGLSGKEAAKDGSGSISGINEKSTDGVKKEDKANKETEEYNKVVDELVKQTGLSKEEIEKQLQGVEKSKLDEAIGLLSDFFANGGQVVNCAADALSEVLNMSTKGLLAFQALLVDISTGVFAKNNKDLINAGQTQLMTSMDAMNEVLHSYGKESVGYGVSVDDFMTGLKAGESGIVWVNEDHYITVTKTEEGNYSVVDSNVNDGKAVEYTAEGFKSAMSGGEAKDKDGKEVLDKSGAKVSYKAVDETGKLKVLTESKGVGKQESAKELTKEEMKEIAGAKYVTQTQTGTRTESRVGTRTETRTGTRTETRTGTSSYTDDKGVSHSSTYTYEVQVEYQYEVEVQYTYEVQVEYTYEVQVWVEDEEDTKAKEKRKAEEEEKRLAKEAEEKAYQAALKKAEEEAAAAFKKLAEDEAKFKEEMKKGKVKQTEEDKKATETAEKEAKEKYQGMTNEEFEKTVSSTEGMKVTGMKVTGIDQGDAINGGYTFGEATFMAALNTALSATIGSVKDYAKALMGAITDTAVNILEGAISGIKEFAYNMLGIGTGQKEGVVIDEEKGTVTQYNANGSKSQVNIDTNNITYDDLKKQIDEQGFDKTVNWLKANNGFASMTAYDTKGKEIYTATRVGYSTVSGKEMAIEYSFAQDYSDQVYFTDAKKGESKVITEKYGSDGQPSSAMVYSSGSGAKTRQTTSSGLSFDANVTTLDKTVEWSTGKDETTGETYRVAKTVDFVGGKDGKASGFEEAKIDSKGNVSVTRYDVNDAYYSQKQEASTSGSTSGTSESSIVDQYKKILENANGLKIQGNNGLYSGYEYVDNSWIDMSKMNTYTYSSASPNVVNKQSVDANNRSTVVTAEFKGDDWRYNRQVVTNSNLNTVTYSEKTESGGTKVTIYNSGVKLDNGLNYSEGQISGANKTWMEYDKNDKMISGGVEYKAGSEISAAFGGSLSGDTIIIKEAVSYSFKAGADGKLELVSGSGIENITGTYINRVDGKEVARGTLSGGKIEVGENGQAGISGKVTIKSGNAFEIGKGTGSGDEESSGAAAADASDTNAKVTESEEGYNVSDGTISLRSGSLVVMGKGAVFKTGSELIGIGKVTEGNLKIADITESGYDFVAESGECKVRQVSEDGVITVDTRYDTSGMMRRWSKNGTTGATLLEEFGRDSGGNLVTTLTTLTVKKTGDSGFGYSVDKLGADGTATLKISDSNVFCTAGAKIYKLFAENGNGDKIGLLYTGAADGTAELQYQLRQAGGITNIATADGKTFYGFQNNEVIEIKYAALDEEGKPVTEGVYFTISQAEDFVVDKETGIYSKTIKDENTESLVSLYKNESGQVSVTSEIKKIFCEGKWTSISDSLTMPDGSGTLVNVKTLNDKGEYVWDNYYVQDENGKWISSYDMKVGNYTVQKDISGHTWTVTDGNSIYNLSSVNGTFNLELSKIKYNNTWLTVNDTITAPDGSGQLVSAKILDSNGKFKYDAYFTLTGGKWTSSYNMQVGNYTAVKENGKWTLRNSNSIYSLTSTDGIFNDLELSKIKYNNTWLTVNDTITAPDGSGQLVSAYVPKGENGKSYDAYFTLSDGKWTSSYNMQVGNYTAVKENGKWTLRNDNTIYSITTTDRKFDNLKLLKINYNNSWLTVNDVLVMPDGSGQLVSAQVKDNSGNYKYDAYFTLNSQGNWYSSNNMQVGNYSAVKEDGKWILKSSNDIYSITTSEDKKFQIALSNFKLNGKWYKAYDSVNVSGNGVLVLGKTTEYSFYCTKNEDGTYSQIKSGMKIGDFTVGKDSSGWTLTTNKKISILNENGLTGELSGTFRLTNDADGFIIKTTKAQEIKYEYKDGTKKVTKTIILNSGAQIGLYQTGCVVEDGIVTVKSSIKIPASTGTDSESKGYSDATGTNAVIVEDGNGGYTVSNGTLRINGGNFVVMGTGAVFKTNSVIAGQKVTSGSITLVGSREVTIDGKTTTMPIFTSYGTSAKTTMSNGAITVNYNKSGVSSVTSYSKTASGVKTNSDGSQYQTITKTTTYYATEKAVSSNGISYNVISYDSKGNLIVSDTKSSYSKNWVKTPEQAKLEKLAKQLSMYESMLGIANKFSNIPFVGKIFSFITNPIERILTNKINAVKAEIYNAAIAVNPDLAASIQTSTGLTEAQIINSIHLDSNNNIVLSGVIANSVVTDMLANNGQISTTYTGAYDLVIGNGGVFYAGVPESARDTFTLSNLNKDDGTPLATSTFSGYITNIELGVYEDGGSFVATGNFDFVNTNADGKYTEYTQPNSNEDSNQNQDSFTVNTSGYIDQSVTGQTTLSGNNAVLSFRNNSAVILGEGTTAWAGSQLQSAGGLTTLTGGNATYSASTGSWTAISEDIYFTFNNPSSAASQLASAFSNENLNVTGLEKLNYSGKMSTISTDAMVMLGTVLQNQNSTVAQRGVNAVVTKDVYSLPSGVALSAGADFNISLQSIDNQQALTFKANKTLNASYNITADWWTKDTKISSQIAAGGIITAESILKNSNSITDKEAIAIVSGVTNEMVREFGYDDVNAFLNIAVLQENTLVASKYISSSDNINGISGLNFSIDAGQSLTIKTILSSSGVNLSVTGSKTAAYDVADGNGAITSKTTSEAVSATMVDDKGNTIKGSLFNISLGFGGDGKLQINNGDFSYNGAFQIKDQESGTSGETAADSVSILTQGQINQSVAGYTTVSSIEGKSAVISIRNTSYTVEGNGAIAWSGSQLKSAGGIVTTAGDNYINLNGIWVPGQGATYTYNNPSSVAENFKTNFAEQGLEAEGLDVFDYSGQMKGYITIDAMTMINSALNNQTAEISKQGIDFTVKSEKYTLVNDIILSKDAEFNMSLQELNGEQTIAFRANNTLDATYQIPDGWTADNNNTSFTEQFTNGQYITAAAILNKAGVTTLTGTNIEWNGQTLNSITVNVSHMDNRYRTSGYDNLAYCYFTLPTTGTIYNSATGKYENRTALTSTYNGTTYYILEGAKVTISANGLSVVQATVYASNMNVSKKEDSGETAQVGQADDSSGDLTSYFEGTITKNTDGEVIATGLFHNYSDDAKNSVFSEATVYNVGSTFYEGSQVTGLGTITDGKVKITSKNADGTLNFAGVGSTATYETELDKVYTIDTEGNKVYQMKESDIAVGDGQKVVQIDGKYYIVNESDARNSNGEGLFNLANDIQASDGKWYESSALQTVAELTDANGNGIGIYVGVQQGNIGNEEKAGWSGDDDIFVIIDGKKVAVDSNGGLFRSGFASGIDFTVSSPNINNGEEITISLTDWTKSSDESKTVMLNDGSVIYVDRDALNITNEQYQIDLGNGSTANVNINYGTRTSYDSEGMPYETETAEITYTVDGVEYTYSGDATTFWGNTKTEYELASTDSTDRYINLDIKGNSLNIETVLVGSRSWFFNMKEDQVTTSVIDYSIAADGSGSQTIYNDFIGEYSVDTTNKTIDVSKIIDSDANSVHNSTSISTTWDQYGRQTSIDNMEYTWTGSYNKDLGRATTINIKNTSYQEIYTYASNDVNDGTAFTTAIPSSKVEYSGIMKDITYNKNQIESFVPENYTETTIKYNGVDKNGVPIEISRQTEIKNAYNQEDKDKVSAYLRISNPEITEQEVNDIINQESKISYQYIDGVKYTKEVSNIKIETSGSVNGEQEEYIKTDYINAQTQNTYQTTTQQQSGSISYKTITTTLSEQDIITEYNNVGDKAVDFVSRSVLETSQITSTLYDDQNRVVYETQKGGIFSVTAVTAAEEVQVGQILSHGNTDKVTSYTYHDNGDIETNTVSYAYNYIDQSGEYGKAAENGTVEVSVTNSIGQILMETTTETSVYGLLNNNKQNDQDYSSRTANYDSQLGHTYSYSQSVVLNQYGISVDSGREDILSAIENLGDQKLTEAALSMTDEQLTRLVSSDNYTIYGINADLIKGSVSIDVQVSTDIEYDARGNISKITKDGGKIGGTYAYELSDSAKESFIQGTDFSSLSGLNFTASGIFNNKSTIDSTGSTLVKQSQVVNAEIKTDMTTGSHNILGDQISFTQYRVDSNYIYDALGRTTSNKYSEKVNGQWFVGEVKTTYSTSNGMTLATSVTSYAQAVKNSDGTFTVDESTRKTSESVTSSYGYNNIGYNKNIDVSMVAVDKYNALGDARDAQRLTRDSTKNAIITAAVTAVYVAATVVLAVCTLGTSLIANVTIALAVAGTAAVVSGMKAGLDALTVGDTATAIKEFVFVALEFTMVLGAIGKALSTSVKVASLTGKAAEQAAKIAGRLSKLGKFGQGLTKIGQTLSKLEALASASKIMKFLNPVTTVGERLKMFSGTSNLWITQVLNSGTGFAKAANLALSIGANYVVYKQALPLLLNTAGLEGITSSDLFKTITTILVFAPIFNKEAWKSSNAGANEAGNALFKKGESVKEWTARMREVWKKTGTTLTPKGVVSAIKDNVIKFGKELSTGILPDASVLQKISVGVNNFIGMSVTNTTRMIKDIAVFQVAMGVAGNGLNTAVYKLTGATLNEILGKADILKLTQGMQVYGDFSDILTTSLETVAGTVSNPTMWVFGALTPVVSPIAGPILQNIPVFGKAARFLSSFDSFFNTSNTDSIFNKWGQTFYEENFKEQLLGSPLDLLPLPDTLKEALQECFDSTPDGNMQALMKTNIETYQNIENKVNTLTATEIQNRPQLVADILNSITGSQNSIPLTSQDIINSRGTYRTLLNSTDSKAITSAIVAEMVSFNIASSGQSLSANQKAKVEQSSRVSEVNSYSPAEQATYLTQALPSVIANNGTKIQTNNFDAMTVDQIPSYVDVMSIIAKNSSRNASIITNIEDAIESMNSKIKTGIQSETISAAKSVSTIINTIGSAITVSGMDTRMQSFVDSINFNQELVNTDVTVEEGLKILGSLNEIAKAYGKGNSLEKFNFISKLYSSSSIQSLIKNYGSQKYLGSLYNALSLQKYKNIAVEDMINNNDNMSLESLNFAAAILAKSKTNTDNTLNKVKDLVANNDSGSIDLKLSIFSKLMAVNENMSNSVKNTIQELAKQNSSEAIKYSEFIKNAENEVVIEQQQTTLKDSVKQSKAIYDSIIGSKSLDKVIEILKKSKNIEINSFAKYLDTKVKVYEKIVESEFFGHGSKDEALFNSLIKADLKTDTFTGEDLTRVKSLLSFIQNDLGLKTVEEMKSVIYYKSINTETIKNSADMKNLIANLLGAEVVMKSILGNMTAETGYSDFKEVQKNAFVSIFENMIGREKVRRYAHILQTGGGKTMITVLTTLLLRMQNTESTKFVGAFTNTIDNAIEIQKNLKNVIGDEIGNVVLLTSDMIENGRENPAKLKEILDSASVITTTYDIWSGVVASDFSLLLSNEEVGKQIQEILTKAGISISEEASGRLSFADAAQSRKALETLVEASKDKKNYPNLEEKISKIMTVPLSRIGDAVCDEIDFFATIPQQALSQSKGKYNTAKDMVKYYNEIQQLQNKKKVSKKDIENIVQKYMGLEIDSKQVERDLNADMSTIQARQSIFTNIDTDVTSTSTVEKILSSISSQQLLTAGLTEVQIQEKVKLLLSNAKKIQYFSDLQAPTKELFEKSGVSKGSIKIADKLSSLISLKNSWSSAENLWSSLLELDSPVDKNAAKALDETKAKEKTVNEKINMQQIINAKAKEIQGKYGSLFTLGEITEHLWNGMGAYSMQENNEYYVKDGRIIVTNLGRGVDNLSLPAGMMQMLELNNGLTLSQPNSDSYVSNSLFAMNLFNNLVGLTGTVSKTNRESVLNRMDFAINGNAPKVDGHSRLFKTETDMMNFISKAADTMTENGRANFNLILAPNSKIARDAYISRVQSILGNNVTTEIATKIADKITEAMNDEKVVDKMDKITDAYKTVDKLKDGTDEEKQIKTEEFSKLSQEFTNLKNEQLSDLLNTQEVKELLTQSGISADNFRKLATVAYVGPDVTDIRLQALKTEVKLGTADFVIGDAYILGRGWDVSKMEFAADRLQKSMKGKESKVQATCWLLESELMTESQVRQGAGRIDPFDDGRFTTKKFTKDIVSLYSVENAREVEALRQTVGKEGVWNIDVIISNLETVWNINENEALKKAGQKVLTQNEISYAQAQHSSIISMDTAREMIGEITGTAKTNEQSIQLEQLGISTTQEEKYKVSKESNKTSIRVVDRTEITREEEFKLATLSRTYKLLSYYIDDANKASNIIKDLLNNKEENNNENTELLNLLKGEPIGILSFIQSKLDKSSYKYSVLENIVVKAEELSTAKSKYDTAYESLTGEEKKAVQEQSVSIASGKNIRVFAKASADLKKAEELFIKTKEKLVTSISGDDKTDSKKILESINLNSQNEIVFNEDLLVINDSQKAGKVIEFVKSCAQTAVEGFGVEYSAEKTVGDYVLDTLKVAGIAEAAVKATEALLGTVRGNLGDNYEYAIVNDASKIKTKVAAYYTNEKGEGHVATVDSEAALKAEEMNGFTFTGIVIADKKEITATNGLGTIYNKEALKNVMKKIDTSKLNAQEAGTAEEVMGEVVNGVTAPSELSKTLEYVLNIWSRDTGAMLEYIGLDKGTELSNTKAIVQAATDKMAEAIEMGKKGELSGAEVRTEIALVTTLRDLLITSSKEAKGKEWVATAGAEEILTKLVISKAVNQNVIIAGMEKENSGKAEEFVIDIQKLQKAISDKNIVFAKDAKIDDVMDMLKDKKTDKYITPMMRLSDIKAVAAAA